MALNVLVTGGCGFIGRRVVAKLHDLGHHVTVIDSLDERVHGPFNAVRARKLLPTGVKLIVADYRDVPVAEAWQGRVVIHLAAQVSVADSAVDPDRYILQNTLGTSALLQELSDMPTVKRLVVASSMSVYGEGGTRVREETPVNPASVYGLTKYDQERLCLIWGEQQKVTTLALRFFNVYSGGQSLKNPYTGVLANFANALLADRTPNVFEDGLQTRDFIHVEDVADAVVKAALITLPTSTHCLNICTGHPTTINEAAIRLAAALGKDIAPTITRTTRPGDIRHCTGDPSRATEVLGWTAKWSFRDGIQEYGEALLQRKATDV